MKTIFLSAMFTVCAGLFSSNGFAQQEQSQSGKNEEIIIRKNDSSPSKMIIEIDSNKITINGKPLADYNGDVTVMKRNFMGPNGNRFFSPDQGFTISGNSNNAFLGVLTAKTNEGVVIKNVIDESGAKNAGLKEGDIITKLGDKEISSPDDLRNAVQSYKPGDNVTINYLRNGKKNSVKVELGKTPNNSAMIYDLDTAINMMGQNYPGNNFNFRMPPMPKNRFFYFNNNNRQKLGLKIEDTENENGAKILNVEKGSAAEKAGLKTGDIITSINGEKINDANDVRSQVMQSQNKNDYKIKVKRGSTDMNFEVHIPKILNSINV